MKNLIKFVLGVLCLALGAMATDAAELGAGVSHLFVYYSDDVADVIGVNCGMLHACEYKTAKVARLSAEDAACDGQPHGATVTVDEGFVGEQPALEYFTADGTPLDGPPSEPGAYKVTMSCAGKSVSRTFKIVKSVVTLMPGQASTAYETRGEAETAAAATEVLPAEARLTRAIDVSAIAAATGPIEEMVLEGAEPGFYYTLFKSADVTAVLEQENHDPGNCDCKALSDGKVTFKNVTKPSDAAGFFSVRAFVRESFTEPGLFGE